MPEGIKVKYMKLQKDFRKKVTEGKAGSLSLSDIKAVADIGNRLQKVKAVKTVLFHVADYFRTFGFKVVKDFDNINYVIVEA